MVAIHNPSAQQVKTLRPGVPHPSHARPGPNSRAFRAARSAFRPEVWYSSISRNTARLRVLIVLVLVIVLVFVLVLILRPGIATGGLRVRPGVLPHSERGPISFVYSTRALSPQGLRERTHPGARGSPESPKLFIGCTNLHSVALISKNPRSSRWRISPRAKALRRTLAASGNASARLIVKSGPVIPLRCTLFVMIVVMHICQSA